ncbi:hypothetical protein C8N24_5424 [Solirubrobacter pauli]|uniref:Uncharacterized protein n=2 Tax=Solirubrobacter pauli TaxID=166793 RepID=A0A660L649_9ACTN|nr:hypothetical protein C8N24_5424 [Solirubrobacter pauli]
MSRVSTTRGVAGAIVPAMNKVRLATVIAALVVAAVPSTASATGGGGPHVRVFDGVVDDAPALSTGRHETAKNSVGNIR